ncbi:MAG: bacteriorhodopsin [Acidimicrobiales bacterium]
MDATSISEIMTVTSSSGVETAFTRNQYYLIYNLFSLVVAGMFGAFVYFLLNVNQVAKQYRNAVVVSAVVVGIAGYHYLRIFTGWSDFEFNEGYRYADWLITVPLLLVELVIVLGIATNKRRPLMIQLTVAAILMIALGYPGENSTSNSTKWIFFALSMIPFLFILFKVVNEVKSALPSQSPRAAAALKIALGLLLVTWFVYPIAYLFPVIWPDSTVSEVVRQAGYSIADLLAKPVYGLAILAVAKVKSDSSANA